jgi:hypothetical protein
MASTGQVDSHAPQEMHSPEITCAMIINPPMVGWSFCYVNLINIPAKFLITPPIMIHKHVYI